MVERVVVSATSQRRGAVHLRRAAASQPEQPANLGGKKHKRKTDGRNWINPPYPTECDTESRDESRSGAGRIFSYYFYLAIGWEWPAADGGVCCARAKIRVRPK